MGILRPAFNRSGAGHINEAVQRDHGVGRRRPQSGARLDLLARSFGRVAFLETWSTIPGRGGQSLAGIAARYSPALWKTPSCPSSGGRGARRARADRCRGEADFLRSVHVAKGLERESSCWCEVFLEHEQACVLDYGQGAFCDNQVRRWNVAYNKNMASNKVAADQFSQVIQIICSGFKILSRNRIARFLAQLPGDAFQIGFVGFSMSSEERSFSRMYDARNIVTALQ